MNTGTALDTDGLSKTDDFYRKSFARRLAKVILGQPRGESLVLSISSEWGAGKTNVLHWMRDVWADAKDDIDQAACIPIADFNPWGVTGGRDLLFHLYEKLIKAIDPHDELLTGWQKLKLQAAKHLGRSGKAVGAMTTAAEHKITGAAIEGATGLFETLCEVGITQVRKSVEDRLARSPWRLVVILDDIDRLEREELLILLRILKRDACLPNTTYVLAMDEVQVSRLIGGDALDAEQRGRRYLEKIVQARLQVPVIPPHVMKDFVVRHINDAVGCDSKLDRKRFDPVFDVLFLGHIRTPRIAKNLANAIRFTSGLMPGEVDTTDLVLLESARLLFPELYFRIQNGIPHSGWSYERFLQQTMGKVSESEPSPYWAWCKQAWADAGKPEPTDTEKRALGQWLPQTNGTTAGNGNETVWWRERRLCSPAYHWRYFACAIVQGDIADADVEALRLLCLSNHEAAKTRLAEELKGERGRVVSEKIVRSNYTPDEAGEMCAFLSICEIDGFDTAELAAHVCQSITDADCLQEVVRRVVEASSLKWAVSFIRNFPSDRFAQESQHKGRKPNSSLARLAERLLDNIEMELDHDVDSTVEAIWMVWHYGQVERLRTIISNRLAKNPEFAHLLLASVCARGIGVKPPRVWAWQGQESISSLKRIVSVEALKTAVSSLGSRPVLPEPNVSGRYRAPDELVDDFSQTLSMMESK